MNPLWLILIVPLAATLGYAICAILTTSKWGEVGEYDG